MWGDTSTMLWQQARKYASEADYNEKTMDTRIEKAGYETMGSRIVTGKPSQELNLQKHKQTQ